MQSLNNNEQVMVTNNLKYISKYEEVDSEDALLRKSDTSNLTKHNEQYTTLLKVYVNNFHKVAIDKRAHKRILFYVSIFLLIIITLATIALMFLSLYYLVTDQADTLEVIPQLIASLSSFLGTFIVIPKIITKYLFNKKEEENLANIIEKIQQYDRDIRDGL